MVFTLLRLPLLRSTLLGLAMHVSIHSAARYIACPYVSVTFLMLGRKGNHGDLDISKADRIYRNPRFRFPLEYRGYKLQGIARTFSVWSCGTAESGQMDCVHVFLP